MGEEASCNAVSVMEAAKQPQPQQQPKENGLAAAGEAAAAADPRLQGISDAIRVVPHFPKEGARALLAPPPIDSASASAAR